PVVNGRKGVVIDGEQFVSVGRGNKLIRAGSVPQLMTPKQTRAVTVQGENYVRTKRGNLVRLSALKSFKKKR
ncbi:hypothetical protein GGI12_005995, partial [Dipsacomyces acuminosporus]